MLKSMGYEYADKQTISFNESYPEIINGAICRSCSYSEIGEPEIEYFLSKAFLPIFIKSILPSENYLSLLDIKQLSQATQVTELRSRILTSIHNNGIVFKPEIELFQKGCPKCLRSDVSAYRWIVVFKDSIIQLEKESR